jgi:hypothetical protein
MGALSIPYPATSFGESANVKCFKGINRARDILRQIGDRWNDRLVIEGNLRAEQYRRGRMAFLVYLKLSAAAEPKPVGVFSEVGLHICRENVAVLVLKADIGESHYLEYWNQQLMLVPDVHIVQDPQGPIPSLVGSYIVNDKIAQLESAVVSEKFLLFESTIYGTYKFLPLISNWEARPFIGHSCGDSIEGAVVHKVKGAAQIMERIAYDDSPVVDRKVPEDSHGDNVAPFLLLDCDGVKIGSGKPVNEFVQVMDVLQGPFNLFP